MKFMITERMPTLDEVEEKLQQQFPELEIGRRFNKFLVVRRTAFTGANVVLKKDKNVVNGAVPSI